MNGGEQQFQNEQQFQDEVVRIAKTEGWMIYHEPYEAGSRPPGFPDLVLVRDKVLFREVKMDTGELSRWQRNWINQLKKAGADVEVWRPKDMEIIKRQLENSEDAPPGWLVAQWREQEQP